MIFKVIEASKTEAGRVAQPPCPVVLQSLQQVAAVSDLLQALQHYPIYDGKRQHTVEKRINLIRNKMS